jgi:hypothetical protein
VAAIPINVHPTPVRVPIFAVVPVLPHGTWLGQLCANAAGTCGIRLGQPLVLLSLSIRSLNVSQSPQTISGQPASNWQRRPGAKIRVVVSSVRSIRASDGF